MALMDSKDAEKLKRQAEFKELVKKLPCPEARYQIIVKDMRGKVSNRLWIMVTPENKDPHLRNEAGHIDVSINGQDMGRTWWDTHGSGGANQYKTIEKAWDALQKRLIGLAYYIQ